MNIYTNSFRCSLKDNDAEFIIQFLQESPRYGEDNSIVGVDTEVVSSVVMTLDKAIALARTIDELSPPSEPGQ